MNKALLFAALLAVSSSVAFAANPGEADKNLTGKVQADNPGVTGGGTTANPTAKPDDNTLNDAVKDPQDKNMETGSTANPTAKTTDDSLSTKATKDAEKAAK